MGESADADRFFRQVLPNGLKVIFEKRDTPIVSTIAVTKFGTGYENLNLAGMAHLIEHTVFRKTKTRSGEEIASAVEKKGGDLNAFTSQELTGYHTKLRSNHFETSMDILSDIMLNPVFTKKDIDKEKKIIYQEMKMYRDSPSRFVNRKLIEQLYAPPFTLIGFPGTLDKITKAQVQKYHNIHYSPSNMIVSVVGKADVDHIWNLSKKYFMKKQVQRQIGGKGQLRVVKGPMGDLVEKRKDIDQAHIAIGYFMPSLKDRLRYAAEIMNLILGVGFSSRLFQQVREKRALAYEISSDIEQSLNHGYGSIYIGTNKNKLEQAKKLVFMEIKKLQKLTYKEVDEAKEQLMGIYTIDNEDSENVAMKILEEELNGDGKEYYRYIDKISAVSLEDVKKVAKITETTSVTILPEPNGTNN